MRVKCSILLLVGLLSVRLGAQTPDAGAVRVLIEAGTDVNGWAVNELNASADDLKDAMATGHNAWLERVSSTQSPEVKVTVTNRYFQGEGVISSDFNPYTSPYNRSSVDREVKIVTARITILKSGKHQNVYSWHPESWKTAAADLEREVTEFVKVNYENIVSFRE